MPQIPYIFNQLVSFLPRDFFEYLVKKHNGNSYIKSYSCWNHLLVMLWAQLTNRRSLRDLETSLRVHSDKLYRMGFGKSISRSNIAKANSERELSIYREMAHEMMQRASRISYRDDFLDKLSQGLSLSGFFAIDSSTVSLCLNKFSWSIPQEGTGGIKLHTMYDLLRNVPAMCLITGHEERDQTFMEDYPYREGCLYMLDRIYFKSTGLYKIASSKAFFITRIKKNVCYDTMESAEVDGTIILADETIRLTSRRTAKGYPKAIRLIKYYSSERNELMCFVTNHFDLDATIVPTLYRYRWQIELFFKWIKQHLRITTFYGTSPNAVMIQIYTAFTAFCMLALAADAQRHKGSLYEFANIMSVSLSERIHLQDLLERYRNDPQKPKDDGMLTLFDFDNLSPKKARKHPKCNC